MGDLTWPVVRERVDGAVVVSEEEIIAAMQLCYERMKVRWPTLCPAWSPIEERAALTIALSIS